MKRIVRRVQTLNERAAELTAAAGQLPSRVAELRQAMTATSGELQNLRSGIQVNVSDLLVDRDEDLSAALVELAGHAPVLAEAGYVLDGMDVEISPTQRLIVQLVHYKEVDTLIIQSLIQRHQQLKSLRAILSAILKARAMVETVDIDGLDYHKLTVGIGPVPTIRLCWRDRATDVDDAGPAPPPDEARAADVSPAIPTSFFGPAAAFTPAETASPATPPAEAQAAAGPEAAATPEEPERPSPPPMPPTQAGSPAGAAAAPPPLPGNPEDPLARFKVMPRLDRH